MNESEQLAYVTRLTARGEAAILWFTMTVVMLALVGAAWLGQHNKDQRCVEDEACWDCHTDGNGRCGP